MKLTNSNMISLIEKRISQIHAVRGFAALLVVIAHAKFPFWIGGQEYIKKYPMSTWSWYEYPIFL
jgi:peptidoglycan/LPS O-acetylase OafA/YrhL